MTGFGAVELSHQHKSEQLEAMKHKTAHYDEMSETYEEMSAKYGAAVEQNKNTQGFFAKLYAETLKPHYGEDAKSIIRMLLLRAQESGIYLPEAK